MTTPDATVWYHRSPTDFPTPNTTKTETGPSQRNSGPSCCRPIPNPQPGQGHGQHHPAPRQSLTVITQHHESGRRFTNVNGRKKATLLLLTTVIITAIIAYAPAASPNTQPADTPTFVTEYVKETVLTTDANLGQPQGGEPPSQQTPELTEESTDPAPTPTDWSDAFVWPTTSPDPIIGWNLQWKIANHLDQIEQAEEDGLPRPIEKRHIVVICTSAEALDRVVAYMKTNSDARV